MDEIRREHQHQWVVRRHVPKGPENCHEFKDLYCECGAIGTEWQGSDDFIESNPVAPHLIIRAKLNTEVPCHFAAFEQLVKGFMEEAYRWQEIRRLLSSPPPVLEAEAKGPAKLN